MVLVNNSILFDLIPVAGFAAAAPNPAPPNSDGAVEVWVVLPNGAIKHIQKT